MTKIVPKNLQQLSTKFNHFIKIKNLFKPKIKKLSFNTRYDEPAYLSTL